MNQPQVAKLVLELRVLMGLTQEQFAALLGVTLSSISRWERGSVQAFTSGYAEGRGDTRTDGRLQSGTVAEVFSEIVRDSRDSGVLSRRLAVALRLVSVFINDINAAKTLV